MKTYFFNRSLNIHFIYSYAIVQKRVRNLFISSLLNLLFIINIKFLKTSISRIIMLQLNQRGDQANRAHKLEENQKQSSQQLQSDIISLYAPLVKDKENFLDQGQTGPDSSDQDSVVSFEDNILEQHLYCALLEIQNLSHLLFGIVSIDQLLNCKQPQPYIERPTLQNYLKQQMSLIKREEVPFFIQLLSLSLNTNKFLQEIFEACSELIVHELIFISFQAFKTFIPIQGLSYTISQLRQLSHNHHLIKIVSHHSELKFLNYEKVFEDSSAYQNKIRQNIQQFLHFYIFTFLLVQENYFGNPYYQKKVKKIKNKKKKIYRNKFNQRNKIGKKIIKNVCNK